MVTMGRTDWRGCVVQTGRRRWDATNVNACRKVKHRPVERARFYPLSDRMLAGRTFTFCDSRYRGTKVPIEVTQGPMAACHLSLSESK
eukprot:3318980-Prymnesium_polylepis.1